MAWDFPALPTTVVEAASAAFGVTISADAAAADPRDLPAFAAIYAHARAEQIVRALARHTNLVLPAATALVIGDGPLADRLASSLAAGGSRVIRGIGDPVARLRAHLAGARTATAPWPAADLVLATGEGHAPVDPASVTGVLIDASAEASGLLSSEGETVRPFVTRVGEGVWVVEAPGVFDAHASHLADAIVALSILHARPRSVPEPVEGPGAAASVTREEIDIREGESAGIVLPNEDLLPNEGGDGARFDKLSAPDRALAELVLS